MSSNIPSIKDLTNAFPTSITPITGEPNYVSLKNLKDQLKTNGASNPTTLGGTNHGYLSLILSPTAYVTIAATPFQELNYPGQHPTIPAGTNAANTSAIIRCHTKDLQQWQECKNVITALKNQLLSAIDNIYVHALKDCHGGYMNQTIHAILNHLFENYGNIAPLELEDNDTKMRSNWTPTVPLTVSSSKLKMDKTMPKMVVNHTPPNNFSTLPTLSSSKTGLYFKECKQWNSHPATEKDLGQLQNPIPQCPTPSS